MKKIVIAGFPNVKNFGDPILFECTEYLLKSIVNDDSIEIARLDLFGERKKGLIGFLIRALDRILNILFSIEKRDSTLFYYIQKSLIKYNCKEYYRKIILDADAIVFAGGGMIKYKYETFDFRLTILTEMARKQNIPVAFNAVGVEGYSEDNIRCKKMKKALNSDIIKSITTRDNIELLNEKYIFNPNIYTDKVADSAFWSNEVYKVSKDRNSEIVGLGVVRGGIFQDNGISITEEQLLNLWVGIITELDLRSIKWNLFTNGLEADNEFLYRLLEKVDGSARKEELVRIPKNSQELVEIVSGFKKVIACRMHASIISYSLDVPSIGLIWNDKIRMFGETIGHQDRFISHQEFSPKYIVDKLTNMELNEEDIDFKNDFRKTTLNSLNRFISLINH